MTNDDWAFTGGSGASGEEGPSLCGVLPLPALPGAADAEQALTQWVETFVSADDLLERIGSGLMGGLAALWTRENQWSTLGVLLSAYGARVMGPVSPRGLPPRVGRIRGRIRFDPPHHGRGWHWDGRSRAEIGIATAAAAASCARMLVGM